MISENSFADNSFTIMSITTPRKANRYLLTDEEYRKLNTIGFINKTCLSPHVQQPKTQ